MSNNELFTITKQYHEKKGVDIWVVRLEVKVDDDTFAELKNLARKLHGYYSKYYKTNGFVFKFREYARKFGKNLDDSLITEETDGSYKLELPEFEDIESEMPETFRGVKVRMSKRFCHNCMIKQSELLLYSPK